MAFIAERSGAYAYWVPADEYFLTKSEDARIAGVIWFDTELHPIMAAENAQIKKELEENGESEFLDESLEGASLAYFFIEQRWSEIVEKFGDCLWSEPVSKEDGDVAEWVVPLIQLLIVSDEASAHLGTPRAILRTEEGENVVQEDDALPWGYLVFEKEMASKNNIFLSEGTKQALGLNEANMSGNFETLAIMIDTAYATVLPKMRTPQVGATLRAFSHYLALLPGSQEVRTTAFFDASAEYGNKVFNLLAVPYPYKIPRSAFIRHDLTGYYRGRWGEFSIQQDWLDDDFSHAGDGPTNFVRFVENLISAARKKLDEDIHGVVFPEAALTPRYFEKLAEHFSNSGDHKIELLLAGVAGDPSEFTASTQRSPANPAKDINVVGMAIYYNRPDAEEENTPSGDRRTFSTFFQPKHHRWKLDGEQLDTYGLRVRLGGCKYWWEKIPTDLRHLHFLPIRRDGFIAALICEDLARIDPCQTVLRAVGPNMVIALLMDGPQLKHRWPARYATVLAEDPGSSVLTLTSAGLIKRAEKYGGHDNCDIVGLWQDPVSGMKEIELETGSQGVILTIEVVDKEERTMDDRSDEGTANVFSLVSVTSVGTTDEMDPRHDRDEM